MASELPEVMRVEASVRRGTRADTRACFDVLWESVTDLGRRQAAPLEGSADDWWRTEEPLHRLLERLPGEWWVAQGSRGQVVGYARSVQRGELLELTEFFVRPSHQSMGLGEALLDRAFPARGGVRSIIATGEPRALSRYYKAGCIVRFPLFTLVGAPVAGGAGEGLRAVPVSDDGAGADDAALKEVAAIERVVLGHDRGEVEFAWLAREREGYLYRRGNLAVGYGFVSKNGSGPIAALHPSDLPGILAHIEGRAHELNMAKLEFQVAAPNVAAMAHLQARGFRIDPWINYLMSDRPFGQFDRFLGYNPPVFL